MSSFAIATEDYTANNAAENTIFRAEFYPRRSTSANYNPGQPLHPLSTAKTPGVEASMKLADSVAALDYRTELVRSLQVIAEPLIRVEKLLAESLRSSRPGVQSLLDYVALLGGKRLRPALLLLTAQARGPASEEAIRLAVVVELVHTATLIHDDILDAATTRRHQPTLHHKWDVPRAILVGDWLFTQAYHLANAGQSTVPGRWVAAAAKAVCEGEIHQGNAAGRTDLAEVEYIQMLAGKTGALTAISCGLGAWVTGESLAICERMYDFGMKLGIAFQIHDDWLDIWGEQSKTGKSVGADLQGGKWTLPLIRFRDTADRSEAERLAMLLQTEGQAINLGSVRRLLDTTDASDYCRRRASELIEQAIESLGDLSELPELTALSRLATAAIARKC